jgi:hypothetical protein
MLLNFIFMGSLTLGAAIARSIFSQDRKWYETGISGVGLRFACAVLASKHGF